MIIDKLLASTVKLYLRSQVEKIKNLKVKITAKDRQILSGELPQVFIAANSAIYQGIYLRQLELTGHQIRINLPEILERKPLKLLEPITINIQALFAESDLQASLASDLLLSGFADFWQELISQQDTSVAGKLTSYSAIEWQEITLQDNLVIMTGNLQTAAEIDILLKITTDLYLPDSQTLVINLLDIQGIPELIGETWQPLKFDLGDDVAIANLSISQNKLFASAEIKIFP